MRRGSDGDSSLGSSGPVGQIDVSEVDAARRRQIAEIVLRRHIRCLVNIGDRACDHARRDLRLVVATLHGDSNGRSVGEAAGIANRISEGIGSLFAYCEKIEGVNRIVVEVSVRPDVENRAGRQVYGGEPAARSKHKRSAVYLGNVERKAVGIDIPSTNRAIDNVGNNEGVLVDREGVVTGNGRIVGVRRTIVPTDVAAGSGALTFTSFSFGSAALRGG